MVTQEAARVGDQGHLAMEQEQVEQSNFADGEEGMGETGVGAGLTEFLECKSESQELWPRLTQLRLHYSARDSHTLNTIRQLEELVSSNRPKVDFKVSKNHELNLQHW